MKIGCKAGKVARCGLDGAHQPVQHIALCRIHTDHCSLRFKHTAAHGSASLFFITLDIFHLWNYRSIFYNIWWSGESCGAGTVVCVFWKCYNGIASIHAVRKNSIIFICTSNEMVLDKVGKQVRMQWWHLMKLQLEEKTLKDDRLGTQWGQVSFGCMPSGKLTCLVVPYQLLSVVTLWWFT